ncbi:MAG: CoA-binding protein [Nanoarchaeota archaeon]
MVLMLDNFFKPTSVAIIGASRNPAKIGHVIMKNMVDGGFHGKVFPINPEAKEILGYRVYKTVTSVNENIDLAIISVPSEYVIKVIDECNKKKIKDVLIVTAGFGEVGNHTLEKQLKDKLDKNGMRCVGVNCLGVFDAYHKFDTLFLPRYRLTRPKAGGISFVCQSGAIGSAILDIAAYNGYSFSKFISYGNATQLDESDFIDYLLNDESTKVICLYAEGIKDGEKFFETLRRATAIKPVIVMKGGLTDAGMKATISHTGSLAGNKDVFFGILNQTNAIRADSLEEMFHIAALFEKKVDFANNRIQIITNGGGYGIVTTDAIAGSKHLRMADMSSITAGDIKKKTPKHMNIGNPLDLLGDATTERYRDTLSLCLADKNIDGIVLIALYQTPLLTTEIVEVITEAHHNSKKPIVVISTGGEFTELLSKSLMERGIPVFNFPTETITALDKVVAYQMKHKNIKVDVVKMEAVKKVKSQPKARKKKK